MNDERSKQMIEKALAIINEKRATFQCKNLIIQLLKDKDVLPPDRTVDATFDKLNTEVVRDLNQLYSFLDFLVNTIVPDNQAEMTEETK